MSPGDLSISEQFWMLLSVSTIKNRKEDQDHAQCVLGLLIE